MDYTPRSGDSEGLEVTEGEEVEVVDSSRAHKYRVRRRKDGMEGSVPSCYLEKKSIVTPPESPQLDPKAQAARARRDQVLKQLVESEEAFARDMQYVVNNYIKEMESKAMPKDLRDQKDVLFTNFKAISEFHNNVLMKGIQYYADDPARLGKTFLRLERDFDMHVSYCRDEPEAQQLLQSGALKEHFDEFSKKLEDEKTLSEHLKTPIQRINDYQLLLKELIKYTARLKESTTDLEKAHDFMQAIPQRIADLQYINSIQGYKGNLHKLGRILKHDWFEVIDSHNLKRERFLFLFKGRIFVTDHKRVGATRSIYLVKNVIKLPEVEIVDCADDDDLKLRFQSLKSGTSGLPLTIKSKTIEQKDDWLGAIQLSSAPHVEDLGDDEFDVVEDQAAKVEELYEKHEVKVEVIDDFEAYEEMHTVVTESVRSGSLTSLEDFHSALDDEPSLCHTVSDLESGGPGQPRFTVPLKAQACAEGMEAVLECEVCANPDVNVAWLKDNSPLASSRKALLEADGGKHRLLIKKAECADSGLYTIIASNIHGTTSCSAPLTVNSAPASLPPTTPDGSVMSYGPIFREKLRDTELQEGTDFRVCVIVEGEPKPTVKFYKGDEELSTSGRVRFNKENDECYELIIDKAKKEDSGKYSCVVKSSAGQNISACDIGVTSSKVFVEIQEDPDRTATPEVIEDNMQWSKDTKEVETEASERFKVSIDESEDTVSLMFQHVTPDDAGLYTCVASTSSGKISCSAELTVQGGLLRDPEAPKLSTTTKKVEAKEGSSALLEMTATGFPKPVITWTKDGEDLKLGDKYVLLQEDDESFTMAIKNLTPEDSGKYCAEAINDMGKDDITYDLKVTSPPKFLKQMKSSEVVVEENIEFCVEIDGSPEPTVTWCKDGQTLVPSDRIIITSEDKVQKLVIKKAKVEDSGNYSCIIKNENGSQGSFGACKVNSPAKFIKGLIDITVNAGEDAKLSVGISGEPAPTVKWKKDGKNIETRITEKKENDTTYTLTIKKTKTEDSGEYVCEITNEHGKDTTKSNLIVKDKSTKPSFKKGLKDTEVIENENLKLEVTVEGTPKPTLKWTKDGKELKVDGNHVQLKKEESEDTETVIIRKTTTEDTGTYSCTITNTEGSETTTSEVKVIEEEKAPVITKKLEDISVTEGETVEFSAKFSGKKTKVTWSKDDVELKIDNKHFEYKKEEAEDSLTLVLNNAKPGDSGKYTCNISNSSGAATTSSNLIVSAEEKAPSFQKGLKDQSIKEGETVNFKVKFSGKPKPTAKWEKDDAELTIDNEHFELRYEEAEDSLTLILNNATKEDEGSYTCKISNSVGSEKTTSKLEVVETTKSPTFTKKLRNLSTVEEESVDLTVEYDGVPKPTIIWKKDGKKIDIDDDRYEISTDDNTETLTINDASKEDSGKYSCTITNSAGSETTESEVTVKETTSAAKFVKGLKDQNVKEEQTVKFNVKISGKPKPSAKWTKDDAELVIDGKHVQSLEEAEDSLTIIIKDAKLDDAGKYTCTITNSEGSDTTSSKLTVSESTSSAEFTQKLKDIEVKEGDTAEFSVKFTGKPRPTAKWTFDSAELTIDNSHTELKVEEDGASLTLIIHDVTKDDSGKYGCTISNPSGSQTCSGKLKVCSGPLFTKTLEDVEAEEGAALRLNVKFEGQPEPVATWKKDGQPLEMDGKHVKTALENDESLTLVIDKIKKEDAGKYSCDIKSPQGTASTSGTVSVTGKPVIKKGLEDKEVIEDEANVELIVEATGTPTPEIKWYLNDKEITQTEKFTLIADELKGIYKLIIKKATSETVGEVKFEIKNPSGKSECKGKLSLLKKPKFLKQLSDLTIVEGDALKLETSVEGYPAPNIKWYLGKSEMDAEECKIISDGPNHSLTIDESSVEDSGTYFCKAKNKIGEASQQAVVTVKSKKDTQAPMFITHLYDQIIVVDDAGRLEAKITGKPSPDVSWYKDDELLEGNDKTLLKSSPEDNTYTLTLKDLQIKDSAKYTCKATNKYGEAKEVAQITVKEPVAPQIEEMQDITVPYGSPARIKAKITGFPKPDVKWLKNDTPVKNLEGFEVISDAETKKYAVSIKCVRSDEIGCYSCVASNQAGEAKCECTLSIKAQAPVFVKDLSDQTLDIGDDFKFQAEVHGYPNPEVSWFKNNKLIESSSGLLASKKGDTYSLEGSIKSVDDGGVFKCKATNTAGEDSRQATLKIADFGPKVIDKLPSSIDLTEGEPLKLQAKITGKPAPEIKWVKDGKPIRPSSRINMSVSPDGVAELSILDMTHDDAGGYKVLATNDKGQTASECNVGVAFKEKSSKPFVGQLHPLEIVVGNPIILETKVTGNPAPKIEWFKDDNKLESGSHIKLSEKDGKAILTIDEGKLEDGGEYKIVVSNDQGEDSSTAAVSVSIPGKKPSIVKELKATKLLEGEEGKLQFILAGYPMPTVAWMHNGRNVLEGQHCLATLDDKGVATLTIQNVKSEDGGMYTAIVSNKLGKASTDAPVSVVPATKRDADKDRKPMKMFEFLQNLMPQLAPEGKPCTLEAKVTTDPKPLSVKWLKDGKEIAPSERLHIEQDPSGSLKLCIANMTSSDRGRYAVVVSDGNTEIKSEAVVNMMPGMPGLSGNKPCFIKGLEPLKVSEGQTIHLKAELPPNSGCAIKWMKDGDDVLKNDRTQILEQPNGAIALIIEGATPEDSGKYVVIATNDEGKTRSSAMVAVVGDGFRVPEIVDSLKPVSFIHGEPGKLTAKIDGEPKPQVKWLKDGSPIEPNERIRMRQEPDGTVSLEILNVKPEDEGKYTLLVSNVGGETRSSAKVEVIQSPLFIKPLEPVTGVVDCPAKLEGKVTGEPMPDIKWTKDGVEISDDEPNIRKHHRPNGEVALIFDKTIPDNAGKYACTAVNKHGEKTSEAPLTIISREVEGESKKAPAFITPLTDLKVQEGDTFKLEATISGNPLPDVHWLLDDQPISCSDTILQSFDGKKVALTVYRCNPRHEGVYECKISNILGDASSKGKVKVMEYMAPHFIERLSDTQYTTNEPMKLTCRVEGIPEPDVEWFFNRDKLSSGTKYSILKEGDKCILTLPHPRTNDSGIYECRAKNLVGKDSCKSNVGVSSAASEGEPAMFLKKLKDTSILNGMTAKLTACICGNPKPEVKWFKDGTQLSENSRLTLEADPNGVIRLIIRGAQKADMGTYRVSIENKFGSDTCTAILGIEGDDKRKPDATKKEAQKQGLPGPPSPLPHAPYIFKMTDNCASLGWRPSIPLYPQVPLTYRLEMCRVPDGAWSTYKSGIKDTSCDIRDLVPGTDYMFRVRVENRYGASEPSPYVTAHRSRLYRPLTPTDFAPKDYDLDHLKLDKYAAAPRFLRTDEDSAYSVRGHPARIEFWVYGCPQPKITWYFNNVPVESGKYDFLEDRNGQVMLFITRMGDDDVGIYTCKAENEHGEAQRKIKLMIAEHPIFTKRLDPTTVMIRKGGEFRCKAIGVPYPKIKWYKDWHPLSESSRIHIKWEEPDTCVLTLSDAILKDGGLYTCTATNVAGTATTSAMLSVEECENEYHLLTYQRPHIVKPSDRPFEDFYDIGDELGRGTQGITYHVVERKTGRSLAAKVMHGSGKLMDFMTAEMDIMSQLNHPRLVRLWDAHETKSSLTLALDICGGGELLPSIIHHANLTESVVAHYIKQILEGLKHMHEKDIAHLGLNGFLVIPNENPHIQDPAAEESSYSGAIIHSIDQIEVVDQENVLPVPTSSQKNAKRQLVPSPLPTFSFVVEPLLEGHMMSEKDHKRLSSLLKEELISFLNRENLICDANPTSLRWKYRDLGETLLQKYPKMLWDLPSKRQKNVASEKAPIYNVFIHRLSLRRKMQKRRARLAKRVNEIEEPIAEISEEDALQELSSVTSAALQNDINVERVHFLLRKSFNIRKKEEIGELPSYLMIQKYLETEVELRFEQKFESMLSKLKNALRKMAEVYEIDNSILEMEKLMQPKRATWSVITTIGDILLTRVNCDNIKIGDFSLATRLHHGREFIQEYGHPEFVAPEIANKQPVSLACDMWSVGIISYILLVGDSPFLRENDRATLKEVQQGRPDFYHDGFAVLSDDARDFVQQLLQMDPSKRMDVSAALKHKWLELDSRPDICDELTNIDRLKDYYKKWRSWYSNAACRWFFRRRTLESCFTHPSRMIYPPDETYTPPATPDNELDRSRIKPAAFDDITYRQRIEREAIDPRSESHYQNGPDTFLLPLRDPDFPVRIRRYLKVGASRSPILSRHLADKHWGYQDVAVKERRKFTDVMDEEIDDEKKGVSRSANLRLRHEVSTPGSGYDHIESRSQKKRRGFRGTAGSAPFFREKIKHAVVRENEDAVFECRVAADPEAQVSWFRNDGILIESSRIIINKWSDGRCSLTLRPAKAYDVGAYKCVARNCHGVSVCRARLNLGCVSAKPDPPVADKISDTEIYLTWMPPKFDGFSPIFGYSLEYKEEGAESWTKIANNISHEFYLVRNLKPGTTYYFHISAVNGFGWSDFSSPSEPILTLAEASKKIELGRAEQFQQDQTDSGQELILDAMDRMKLDYGREDEPIVVQEAEPTELYNYISEIAKGRFSLVMKVWQKKVNGTFVAKALDLSGSSKQAAEKEFEIYKSLQHEKIANLHSVSASKTSMFFVMEKLSGIDVISYLSMRPLYTEDLVSRIIHQVIDALEYLHFRGICYFELQPDNVVMEDRHHPNIKLVDFGSAQFVPEEGAKVQVNGDLEYLAPEVVKGEEVHTPADIWGVGVLTYILLSGVSPFLGESKQETKDNILFVRYHFDHLYKEATPEATHFLMQLFKRTPQKRPTAEECLENKWLLPNEFMIKKREHAVFLSHNLREFSENFHSLKSKATPTHLLNIFGKSDTR